MPYIVLGESTYSQGSYKDVSYEYNYPNELDLSPGSDLHKKLVSEIGKRANASRKEISKRFPSWREMDKVTTLYMPADDKEALLKEKEPDKPISIVFPYSYSMLEALLTYLCMAFFQDPIFRYEGVEADDIIGGMLLEHVIKLHCIKNKVPLALHTALRDSLTYGIGIGLPTWIVKKGRKAIKSSVTTQSQLGSEEQSFTNFVDTVLFEGNGLDNVEPYMWLPDPSVSSDGIQKGEFLGWIDRDNYMNLLSEESDKNSGLFNVKYLKHKKDRRSALSVDQSERDSKEGGSSRTGEMSGITNPVDTINMYITLIPKDWKLSNHEYPQKWLFRMAADDLIISCERADHHHGMYPMVAASPEYNGYSIAPIGRMEVISGLQTTLDFLFNSHIRNVRKAINDMLIYDPFLVNANDLKDPRPGKLIRLRRPAWGRGVDKVVQQLQVQDITRANIADSAYITQWMDRVSGADQSMQGSVRQGGPERLTKSEFLTTRGSAVSRLQRVAMIVGMQFMQDLGEMYAVHTQQYMTEEMTVRVTGRYAEQLMEKFKSDRIKVSKDDVSVGYDLIVRDGTIPGGNFSEAWIKMFEVIGTNPELMQQFDITRIFMFIAEQLGAKNIEDFKRNVNNVNTVVGQDEDVLKQVQAGNLVSAG